MCAARSSNTLRYWSDLRLAATVVEVTGEIVDRAAAVTRVGVIVAVLSGSDCDGGMLQVSLMILVITLGIMVYAFSRIVPMVIVTVFVTGCGVTVVVGLNVLMAEVTVVVTVTLLVDV